MVKKTHPLGPYRRPMPRVLGGSWGDGRFHMGEAPLYMTWIITSQDPLRGILVLLGSFFFAPTTR